MPRTARRLGRPVDYCPRFPDGPVADDAPAGVAEVAAVVREIRRRLAAQGRSVSALARDADLDRSSLHAFLTGRAFIDVVTLARLERALGGRLWPG